MSTKLCPPLGIWYGSPYIELTDSSYIASTTGYTTTIEYRGKGYFSGKAHSFKASIHAPLPSAPGVANGIPAPSTTPKFVAEGTWTETSKLKQGNAPFTDVTGPKVEVEVSDLEGQDPYETRNLWKDVARGIRTGDFDLASREKSKIEVCHIPSFSPRHVVMSAVRADCLPCLELGATEAKRRGGSGNAMADSTLQTHRK